MIAQLETALIDILVISLQLGIPLVVLFLIGYLISAHEQSSGRV